jgi:hypothetical protein
MVFRSPGKVSLTKLLKHILFALEYAYNSVLGVAPYMDWKPYRPTFAVRKVYLKDATLTTVPMLFIEDWDFSVRPENRDGGSYVFRTEGMH